jgi:hypothetical protein
MMFNKFITVNDNQAIRDAASVVARATKEHNETLKNISDAEIKSKDRVDIPLRDYLRMKEDLERTSRELMHVNFLLAQMGIPAEVVKRIEGGSIHVESCADFRDYKRTYRIAFTVDERPMY